MIINISCLAIGIGIGVAVVGFPILLLGIKKKRKKDDKKLDEDIKHPEETKKINESQKLTLEQKLDFIYRYLGIGSAVKELGYFTSAYDDFIRNVERELQELSSGRITGNEYIRRQRMVEFALCMAIVYARVEGDPTSISGIEKHLKRARKLH